MRQLLDHVLVVVQQLLDQVLIVVRQLLDQILVVVRQLLDPVLAVVLLLCPGNPVDFLETCSPQGLSESVYTFLPWV